MGLILGTQLLAANVTQPYPDPGLKRTPIKVALLSLPPRTQSLLEFFFTNAGRGSFMACTEEQAETAIFDLDTPASRDHWLIYNARTGCPGIALAVKPQEVPGALWVQKPVTPAALLAAAASLRAAASTPAPERVSPVPATLTAETAAVPVAPAVAEAAPIAAPAPAAPAAPAAPTVQAAPAFTASVIAETAVAPMASAPAQAEPPAQPTAQPASSLAAEPVADTAPSVSLGAAPAAGDLDSIAAPETAAAAAASLGEPAPVAAMNPAPAARADMPPAETPSSGRTFWQRLFGTAGRKSTAPASGWAADVAAASAASPAAGPAPAPTTPATDDPANAITAAQSGPAAKPEAQAPHAVASPVAESEVLAETAATASEAVEVDASTAEAPNVEPVAEPQAQAVAADAVGEPEAAATPTAADTTQPEAIEEAAEADESTTLSSGFPATEPADPPSELPDAHPAVGTTATGSSQEALFGGRADVPAKELVESAALRFDPEKYLVGVLREAFMVATKWEVPTQFDCGAGFIVVDAERNELHSSLDDVELQALASTPLSKRSKVQTLSNLDYVRFKQALQDSGKARCTRLDDAIWRAAMWGSAGRLPAGTNPSRTVFLRQWPNLTRIAPVPQGPRLAALWALRGGTVLDSCKQFNLPQRHVIGFYNGVWALNLLTEDGSFARRTQRKGARNRGLLTRLLGWLRR